MELGLGLGVWCLVRVDTTYVCRWSSSVGRRSDLRLNVAGYDFSFFWRGFQTLYVCMYFLGAGFIGVFVWARIGM